MIGEIGRRKGEQSRGQSRGREGQRQVEKGKRQRREDKESGGEGGQSCTKAVSLPTENGEAVSGRGQWADSVDEPRLFDGLPRVTVALVCFLVGPRHTPALHPGPFEKSRKQRREREASLDGNQRDQSAQRTKL